MWALSGSEKSSKNMSASSCVASVAPTVSEYVGADGGACGAKQHSAGDANAPAAAPVKSQIQCAAVAAPVADAVTCTWAQTDSCG
eukprot:187992-Chlamydomonas_euryale.AAC.1